MGPASNRDEVELAVLDAVLERGEEGITVLELRSLVDTEIDGIEKALTALKEDELIVVEPTADGAVIRPADHVSADDTASEQPPSLIDRILDRLPF